MVIRKAYLFSDTGTALEAPDLQQPKSLLPKDEHDRCDTPSDFEFGSIDVIAESDDQQSLEPASSAPELLTAALPSDKGSALEDPGRCNTPAHFEFDSNDVIAESDDDHSSVDTDSYDFCRPVSGDVGNSAEVHVIFTDGPGVSGPLSIGATNTPLNELDEQWVMPESNELFSSQTDSVSQNLDSADDVQEPSFLKREVTEHSTFSPPEMVHRERLNPEIQRPTGAPSSSVASLDGQGVNNTQMESWAEVYGKGDEYGTRSLAGSFSEHDSEQNAHSGEFDGQELTEQVGQGATEPDSYYNARELKADSVAIPMPMASTDSPVEGVGLPVQFSAKRSTLHLVLRLRENFDQGLQNTEYQSDSDSLSTTSESSFSSMVSSLSSMPYEDDADTESSVSASSSRETLCDDEENFETGLPGLKNTFKEPLVASTHSTSESILALLPLFDPLFESRPDDMSTDCKEPSSNVSGQETLAREDADRLSQPHRRTDRERVSDHKGYKGWLEDNMLEPRVPSRWEHSPRGENLHWYDACWNETLRNGCDFTEDVRYRCMPVLEYRSELQSTIEENNAFNYSPVKPEKRVQTEFRKNADIQQYNAFVNDQVAGLNASVEAHKKDKNGLRLSALCAQENQRQESRFKAPNTSLNQIRKQQSGLTYNVNGEELVWRAFETDTSF